MVPDKHVFVIQMADHPCVRMRKVIRSLMDRQLTVAYVGCRRGRPRGDSLECERISVPPAIPSASVAKIFLAPIWAMFAAIYLRTRRTNSVCYAADFEAGAAAYLSGRPYVYDVLDTYADRYQIPSFLKSLLRWMEGVISRRADTLIHVDRIRLSTLPVAARTAIVRNVPRADDLQGPVGSFKFDVIASGNLDENRGVDQLLDAASEVGANVALIGRVSNGVQAKLESMKGVTYFGYVDSARAIALTRQSKAVFAAYDPTRAINLAACPNKFYDAMACGLPIILNREIQLARTVLDAGTGWAYTFGDVGGLASILDSVRRSDADYVRATEAATEASGTFPLWDEEFAPVINRIREMLE